MIRDRIKWGKSVEVSPGVWYKTEIRAKIEPGDDVHECKQQLKKEVDEMLPSEFESVRKYPVAAMDADPISPSEILESINNCTTKESLLQWKYVAQRDPELQLVYNAKMNQL